MAFDVIMVYLSVFRLHIVELGLSFLYLVTIIVHMVVNNLDGMATM